MNRSMGASPTVLLASLNSTILPGPHYVRCLPRGLHERNCRETDAQFVVKVFLCNKSSDVRNKGRRRLVLWQASHATSACLVSGPL